MVLANASQSEAFEIRRAFKAEQLFADKTLVTLEQCPPFAMWQALRPTDDVSSAVQN